MLRDRLFLNLEYVFYRRPQGLPIINYFHPSELLLRCFIQVSDLSKSKIGQSFLDTGQGAAIYAYLGNSTSRCGYLLEENRLTWSGVIGNEAKLPPSGKKFRPITGFER